MKMRPALPAAALLILAAGAAHAADPPGGCIEFAWDVRAEHLLFAMNPLAVAAGTDRASTPTVSVDRLYQLHLQPHAEVKYPMPPGVRELRPDGYGGLALLQVAVPGTYRISADQPLWIDVAFNGALLKPLDYQGRRDCTNPHKIVEFQLPMGVNLTLQISNATSAEARISVTPAPATSR
jgi:hypothetical protein